MSESFLIKTFLLIGQTSVFNTIDIRLSLSLFSSSHSNNRWSIVRSLVSQGHVGVTIILNRCKFDLMFAVPRDHAREFVSNVYFHIQSVSHCREIFFCDLSLCFLVPFSLPRFNASLTKFTYHYTFWNFIVAIYDVRFLRCLLCECAGQLVSWDHDVSLNPYPNNVENMASSYQW